MACLWPSIALDNRGGLENGTINAAEDLAHQFHRTVITVYEKWNFPVSIQPIFMSDQKSIAMFFRT
jgi:hypothetical protein